jgi:hypothetical protein
MLLEVCDCHLLRPWSTEKQLLYFCNQEGAGGLVKISITNTMEEALIFWLLKMNT